MRTYNVRACTPVQTHTYSVWYKAIQLQTTMANHVKACDITNDDDAKVMRVPADAHPCVIGIVRVNLTLSLMTETMPLTVA